MDNLSDNLSFTNTSNSIIRRYPSNPLNSILFVHYFTGDGSEGQSSSGHKSNKQEESKYCIFTMSTCLCHCVIVCAFIDAFLLVCLFYIISLLFSSASPFMLRFTYDICSFYFPSCYQEKKIRPVTKLYACITLMFC